MNHQHKPVFFQEVLNNLNVREDGVYVDGTFGRGGHARAILEKLGPNGRLYAIDRDPEAVEAAKQIDDPRFHIHHGGFDEMAQMCEEQGITGKVDGILLDLGVSSPQLDDAARGFSFMQDGPLDMRMDPSKGISAAEWLAKAEREEITKVLRDYGEEKQAWKIAGAIVESEDPLTTTAELATLIETIVPRGPEYLRGKRMKNKHPATRSFQAIRIFINGELQQVEDCLPQCLEVLGIGGRLVVIAFHSLEDRIVKQFIARQVKGDDFPKDMPVKAADLNQRLKHVGKRHKPTAAEIDENPRARSAVLRVAEKIA